jgi:hypothetical protein
MKSIFLVDNLIILQSHYVISLRLNEVNYFNMNSFIFHEFNLFICIINSYIHVGVLGAYMSTVLMEM